jgi:hypothetical protein
MTWQTVGPRGREVTRVTITAKQQVRVFISADVLAHLGWKKGELFALSLGQDEHAGKLQIRRSAGGYKLFGDSRYGMRLGFCRWQELGHRMLPVTNCKFDFEEGALVIHLPAALR